MKTDIQRRFAGLGITRYFYLLDPQWVERPEDNLGAADALKHWAQHFAVDRALLQR